MFLEICEKQIIDWRVESPKSRDIDLFVSLDFALQSVCMTGGGGELWRQLTMLEHAEQCSLTTGVMEPHLEHTKQQH